MLPAGAPQGPHDDFAIVEPVVQMAGHFLHVQTPQAGDAALRVVRARSGKEGEHSKDLFKLGHEDILMDAVLTPPSLLALLPLDPGDWLKEAERAAQSVRQPRSPTRSSRESNNGSRPLRETIRGVPCRVVAHPLLSSGGVSIDCGKVIRAATKPRQARRHDLRHRQFRHGNQRASRDALGQFPDGDTGRESSRCRIYLDGVIGAVGAVACRAKSRETSAISSCASRMRSSDIVAHRSIWARRLPSQVVSCQSMASRLVASLMSIEAQPEIVDVRKILRSSGGLLHPYQRPQRYHAHATDASQLAHDRSIVFLIERERLRREEVHRGVPVLVAVESKHAHVLLAHPTVS